MQANLLIEDLSDHLLCVLSLNKGSRIYKTKITIESWSLTKAAQLITLEPNLKVLTGINYSSQLKIMLMTAMNDWLIDLLMLLTIYCFEKVCQFLLEK